MKKQGIKDGEIRRVWQDKKDRLPNLQLMEGRQNESKNKKPFDEWLHGKIDGKNPNVMDITKFKKDNYIPKNISLNVQDFDKF